MKQNFIKKRKLFLFFLIGLAFLTVIGATSIGSVDISLKKIFAIVFSRLPFIQNFFPVYAGPDATIILLLRLPRVLFGLVIGIGLAVSGTSMQGTFKNPMASPFILGVSSGGALGAAIGIHFELDLFFLPILAFLIAMNTTFLVFFLGRIRGKLHIPTLLLGGLAMNFLMSALFSYVLFLSDTNDTTRILSFIWGSLSGIQWIHLYITLPLVFLGFLLVLLYSRDLNVMQTGEESAKQLGVEVERTKIIQIITASFIAAVVVSFSGVIGFVGLIMPHTARLIVGPDHKILIPSSALMGGIFLVWSDTISRSIGIPVGIITGLVGAPFFIFLLVKKRGETGW